MTIVRRWSPDHWSRDDVLYRQIEPPDALVPSFCVSLYLHSNAIFLCPFFVFLCLVVFWKTKKQENKGLVFQTTQNASNLNFVSFVRVDSVV